MTELERVEWVPGQQPIPGTEPVTAAEELRAAAEHLHVHRFDADPDPAARWPEGAEQVIPDCFYRGIRYSERYLRERADTLDPARRLTEEERK